MRLRTLHKRKKRILSRKRKQLSIKYKGIEIHLENSSTRVFLNGKELPQTINGKSTLVGFEFTHNNRIDFEPLEPGEFLRRPPNTEMKVEFSVDPEKLFKFFGFRTWTEQNEEGNYSHFLMPETEDYKILDKEIF